MTSDAASRRLANLASQVGSSADSTSGITGLSRTGASASASETATYAVPLPEKLSEGDFWRVYRYGMPPPRYFCRGSSNSSLFVCTTSPDVHANLRLHMRVPAEVGCRPAPASSLSRLVILW